FSYQKLKELCDRLINDYESNKYKQDFAWVDHLNEVDDPTLKEELDNELLKKVNDLYNKIEEHNIHMASPVIINMEDNILYSFIEAGKRFNELSLTDYFELKKPIKERDYNLGKLKRDKIFVHNETNNQIVDRWSVYDSLNAEIDGEESTYILSMGIWYSVDSNFIMKINNTIKDIKTSSL